MTGVIGTSNLPVSGMTIAALLIITLFFLGMGWTSKEENTILLFESKNQKDDVIELQSGWKRTLHLKRKRYMLK
mgnify:CR=1 FL=1